MSSKQLKDEHRLRGNPRLGLAMATVGFFTGLTSIVVYGVAGPVFKESLGLSSTLLAILLASPHVTKSLLRIPFGAWVDKVGGKKPFLILLVLLTIGMLGLVLLLVSSYPENFNRSLYPYLIFLGLLVGCGGVTFSVGIPQTSYWFPQRRQGYALGFFAGMGNLGPGVANLVIPILVVIWGLTGAYSAWLIFIIIATAIYAVFAVDAYYFQLVGKGVDREKAFSISQEMGQEIFPVARSVWESLKTSAKISRTWALVFLYMVSFGGGFVALTAWFPTYWGLFHDMSLVTAGLLAGAFTIYGSLIRVPSGGLCDRFGGERIAIASFATIGLGAVILAISESVFPAFLGMMILGTGMGVANAAVFKLVPKYVPEAVGGASGWVGGLGGAGTLIIIPVLGVYVDAFGQIGYARGFIVFVLLSAVSVGISYILKLTAPGLSRPPEKS
jgi:NNP family nitrate/nitrite transporter-like MFS transporter